MKTVFLFIVYNFQNLDLYVYKNSIKTSDIGFTAKVGDSNTKFEIWFRKRKPGDTYTLVSMTEDIKQAWTDELSNLLWKQALRNRGTSLTLKCKSNYKKKPLIFIVLRIGVRYTITI